MRSAVTRFVDHFLSVCVSLRDDLLVTLLRFGELLLDFFRVDLAFFDLAPPLLEHRKDWLVSEAPEKQCPDHKAKPLRKEQLPGPAECFGCLVQRFIKTTRCGGGDDHIHTWAC